MEPTTPEPQRLFSIPTFDEVQATFRANPTLNTFPCLLHNDRPRECVPLEASQVQNAARILCSNLPRTLQDVWNVVNCLVCVQHQGDRVYTHKHRVKNQWHEEFPNLNLSSSPMPRSRYSLCSTPRSASRSTPLRYARAGTTSPTPVTPSRERRATEPEDPEDQVDEDVEVEDDPFIATPDNTRPSSPVNAQQPDPQSLLEEDRPPTLTSNFTPPRTPSPNSRQRTFVPGTSSTWPLWRVRQEVRHLLFEPLPAPRAHGTLYAVESLLHHHKVKIGYTMRRNFNERLQELEKQHGGPLGNPWRLSGIPYVQLLRLEKLVHADLAKYQCDYKVPFGRGNGYRVHREWFDISLATAQKTTEFWWAAMRHLRMRPGRELSEQWRDRLTTQGAMFDVNVQNIRGAFDDHRDHEKALQLWTQLLQVPEFGWKTWMPSWWLVIFAIVAQLCRTLWAPNNFVSMGKSTMLLLAIGAIWLST